MLTAQLVFWVSLLLVAHTYLLYPVFLLIASTLVQMRRDWRYLSSRRDRRPIAEASAGLPAVTLVIAAHNEESRLRDKLANLQQLDYPHDQLQVVFVSDGSTDATEEILRGIVDPRIETIILPVRGGKSSALNHGVARARHGILIFSDAATLFAPDALRKLARHFTDPRVGVVCGALRFEGTVESRRTEGVYWSYECMLRLMEARVGATLTASGAIYAVRRECYVTLPANTLVEDLIVPMNARRLGYRVLYDPEAVGTDFAAGTVAGEFTRRVRVATGSFLALRHLVRIRLDPMTVFAFLSHKLLRWILPFLLIGLLASSAVLSSHPFYGGMFIAQLTFYLWAALGFLFRGRVHGVRYALFAYYLLAIHLAYLVGFVRFVTRRTETAWQRVN
jgi:cellulose synthase/poly-beta-1,6-N-acetylglucosamine synthase-like glycosyltransferase